MKTLLACVAALLCFASVAALAGTTGKIAGKVTDATTRQPLPGVNVIIEGTKLGISTDLDGNFVIINVPPGVYTVSVSLVGYQPAKLTNVRVSIDLTTTINFQIVEAPVLVGEEVIVAAQRPIVQKDLTSSEARVTAEQLTALPVLELGQVLRLLAGVTVGPGGDLHIRGGRTSEIAYWVDGIPVSDVYHGGSGFTVENVSIQELQMISGTFNAEYGQAMSGIINMVTKEGSDRYSGTVSWYSGDYVTNEKDLYLGLDKIDPVANYNIQASASGPIPAFKEIASLFVTGRYSDSDGWLYGKRIYHPAGDSADGAIVPMNWRKRYSAQAKLTLKLAATAKLNLSALGSRQDFQDYSHDFKYNPDGRKNKFDRGYNLSATLTHSLSPRSFYTLQVSHLSSSFKDYLYSDPLDPRYQHPNKLNRGAYRFLTAGTDLHRFDRETRTWLAKLDFTAQVSNIQEIKIGGEGRLHRLFLEEATITPKVDPLTGRQLTPFQPALLDITTPFHDWYKERPREFSGYAQTKIEYSSVIVNLGFRVDYFDSRGRLLADPEDPNIYQPFKLEHQAMTLAEREAIWYKKATPKWQISPRVGIAYPITDRGVFHFSYGHFLQIPPFLFLYNKPGFKVTTSGGVHGVWGNADLEPQKTAMYELGLQQQLASDIGIHITGFYRDVRNWVTTSPPIPTVLPGVAYVRYINRDYANVRGITLSLTKRPIGVFAFDLNYTFQVAEGSNSDPNEEFFAIQGNQEPTRAIIPMSWDQRHTLNLSLNFRFGTSGVSLTGRYGSGLPYTPDILRAVTVGQNVSTLIRENSRRKPATFTVDLHAYKSIHFGPLRTTVFAKVFNVFDRRNELHVFGDTGRAGVTTLTSLPDLDAGYFTRPDFYSEPREIQLGLEIGF